MGRPVFLSAKMNTAEIKGASAILAAAVSSTVLEILDRAAPTYFDDCYDESAKLQRRLEKAIFEAVKRFLQ